MGPMQPKKGTQMSDFTKETQMRFPSHDEVERILARARQMRAAALRHGMLRSWAMLQRVVTRKPGPRAPRHA